MHFVNSDLEEHRVLTWMKLELSVCCLWVSVLVSRLRSRPSPRFSLRPAMHRTWFSYVVPARLLEGVCFASALPGAFAESSCACVPVCLDSAPLRPLCPRLHSCSTRSRLLGFMISLGSGGVRPPASRCIYGAALAFCVLRGLV